MKAINEIRKHRVYKDVYQPLTASSETEGMKHVKYMSRTENFYTYKNYFNIKRWNTEQAYRETIIRTITVPLRDKDNEYTGESRTFTFTLEPDSPLWIFPFPQSATLYNPNLTQNYE